jgi:hypothetical protein
VVLTAWWDGAEVKCSSVVERCSGVTRPGIPARGVAGVGHEQAVVRRRPDRGNLARGSCERVVVSTDVFTELKLRRPESTAIDVASLLRAIDTVDHGVNGILALLAQVICGVPAAVIVLTDPQLVVLGRTEAGRSERRPAHLDGRYQRLERLARILSRDGTCLAGFELVSPG